MNQHSLLQQYGLLNFKQHVTQKGCCRDKVGSYIKYQNLTPSNIDDFMMTLAENQDFIKSKEESIQEVTREQLIKNISNLVRVDQFSKSKQNIYIYKHKEGFRLKCENVMSFQLYASTVKLEEGEASQNEDLVPENKSTKIPTIFGRQIEQNDSQKDSVQSNEKKLSNRKGQQSNYQIDSTLRSTKDQKQIQRYSRDDEDEEYFDDYPIRKVLKRSNTVDDQNDQSPDNDYSDVYQTSENTIDEQPQKFGQVSQEEEYQTFTLNDSNTQKIVTFDQFQLANKTSLYTNQGNICKTFLMNIANYQHIMSDKLKKGYQTYYHLKQSLNEYHLIYISIFTLNDDSSVPNPEWGSFKNYLLQGIQNKFQFDDPLNYYYCKIGYTKNIEKVDVHFKNYNAKFYKAFLCYREREEQNFHRNTFSSAFRVPINYPFPYEGKGEIYVFHPLLEWLLEQKFKKYKLSVF